jgi:hypothetical protein
VDIQLVAKDKPTGSLPSEQTPNAIEHRKDFDGRHERPSRLRMPCETRDMCRPPILNLSLRLCHPQHPASAGKAVAVTAGKAVNAVAPVIDALEAAAVGVVGAAAGIPSMPAPVEA